MTKEKYASLTKYVNDLKNKLTSELPAKHKNRKQQYHNFLNKEIAFTTSQLQQAALDAPKGK
jgi:hypothetical protein